ncbi:GNAT family N-acetyltransferase [Alteribacillus sp. HJP-4]|uniref:GNAT family N-acetyltransferase n=1 Tax=Alteribacillus sp. HJP-4 TaxID=2775394 RepID=UPI0035CCFAEE
MAYHNQFFMKNENKYFPVSIRNYTKNDFNELIEIQRESFPPPFSPELLWDKDQLSNHVTFFPDGALCAEIEGTLAGSMTALIVQLDTADVEHSWEEMTDDGFIRNHDPNGNTLYIVDICIRPSFRNWDLGKKMMQAMYEIVVHHQLDQLIGGGRLPGYHKVAEKMTPDEYVRQVLQGELKDPVLSFLLSCGRTPIGIAKNYIEDEESHNYAAITRWKNPFK